MTSEDIAIELARTVRECADAVDRRIRSRQLGEAWADLPAVDVREMFEGPDDPAD